jgi:putative transposase
MSHHLGYEKSSKVGYNSGNSRNGISKKKVITEDNEIEIEVPRDRESTFEPQIIKKHQRRFEGFDDKIVSMYARGMTNREIQAHLQEIYGVDVSPDLISTVTDEVLPEVNEWRNRPLNSMYLIVYLDALVMKVKEDNQIKNKALYLIVGITTEGRKEVLGLWMTQNEGAKFWLSVVSELKNRGVQDILISSIDGLKGFPEAINTVFPKTQIQLCIIHMIRNSLKFVSYKDYKAVVADLKKIYKASNEQEAREQLDIFAENWSKKYPSIAKSWIANWSNIAPFLTYPEAIRKIMYTTNTIESVNSSIRKVTKNRNVFPNDDIMTPKN